MTEPKLIAEGHWGRVFDLGDNTVAKCFRTDADPKSIQLEAEIASVAANHGVPTPAVLGLTNEPGNGTIRFQKINGDTLARHVLQQPWRLIWATRQMARIFAELHKVDAPETVPFKQALVHRIEGVKELSDAEKSLALDRLETLEDGNRLCHYDYHPGNLMVAQNKCFVIDWGGAVHGAPIADVTHAFVLNKVDGTLQDVPLLNRLIIRSLRGLYIQLFIYFYAKYSTDYSYKSLRAGIRSWILPIAAARLASYGDFENRALLRIVRANLNKPD